VLKVITCPNCQTTIDTDNLKDTNQSTKTTKQSISKITGSGNNFNQSSTENGDIVYVNDKPSELEVQYSINNEKEVNSNILFLSGLPAVLIGIWGFLGDTSSIFSLFKTSNDPFSGLASSFFGLVMGVILAIIFAISIAACIYFLTLYFGEEIKSLFSNNFFKRQSDGRVVAYVYQADCQTGNCKGKLIVGKAEPNEENETYVGRCSENPTQHIYSFDKSLKTGKPIKLTPKKTPPPSN